MKILITTGNQDKYKIISKLIITAFETNIDFDSLDEFKKILESASVYN